MPSEQIEIYKPLNQIVSFYRDLAKEYNLNNTDIDNIFKFKYIEPEAINNRSISMKVNEKRKISFDLTGKLIEVIGKNQIGKTTSIIYLANLLGYDFYDKENIDFLKDDQVIEKGKEIYEKIKNGIDSNLKLIINNKELDITTHNGLVNLKFINDTLIYEDKYSLTTQTEAFRNKINEYVDVHFISKGRDFVTQVLMDIVKNMKFISLIVKDNGERIISDIRLNNSDLLNKVSFSDGIDIVGRRSQLQDELIDAEREFRNADSKYQEALLKQDNIKRILNEIISIKTINCYKIKKDIYELNSKIIKLLQRKETLEKYESDNIKTIARIDEIAKEIVNLNNEIKDEVFFTNQLELLISQSIKKINIDSSKFLDRENYERIINALQQKNIRYLKEIESLFDPKAKKAIEDIYEVVKKHDSDIKLPQELGGNMLVFKELINEKRKEILDNNLIILNCNEIILLLKDNNIGTNEGLISIIEKINTTKNKIKELETESNTLLELKDKSFKEEDKIYLKNTIKEIEGSREKIKSEEEKLKICDNDEINKIEELIRLIKSIQTNPEIIIFSDDIDDILINKRTELESSTNSIKLEYNNKKAIKESIETQISVLDNYINNAEIQLILLRLDHLRSYQKDINIIQKLLEDYYILLENKINDDTYITLSQKNIISKIISLINNMFIEKCQNLFILEKNKYIVKKIIEFDYRNKNFKYDSKSVNLVDISGGTGSVLTVLTLASTNRTSKIGSILLVDEFNDVVGELREIAVEKINETENVAFTFLVKPESTTNLSFNSILTGV